jgi:hypothetical protein
VRTLHTSGTATDEKTEERRKGIQNTATDEKTEERRKGIQNRESKVLLSFRTSRERENLWGNFLVSFIQTEL